MKLSIVIVLFFVFGILLGSNIDVPIILSKDESGTMVLYLLMFSVGLGLGADKNLKQVFQTIRLKMLLVPASTIVGTFIGITIYYLIFADIRIKDLLAIGSGFGYYSLSSILIAEFSNKTLGVIALISNILREVMTILLAPVIVKYFGKLAPISAGGATSMDTTLPIIVRFSGKEYTMISIVHGIILSLLVPIFISLIYRF